MPPPQGGPSDKRATRRGGMIDGRTLRTQSSAPFFVPPRTGVQTIVPAAKTVAVAARRCGHTQQQAAAAGSAHGPPRNNPFPRPPSHGEGCPATCPHFLPLFRPFSHSLPPVPTGRGRDIRAWERDSLGRKSAQSSRAALPYMCRGRRTLRQPHHKADKGGSLPARHAGHRGMQKDPHRQMPLCHAPFSAVHCPLLRNGITAAPSGAPEGRQPEKGRGNNPAHPPHHDKAWRPSDKYRRPPKGSVTVRPAATRSNGVPRRGGETGNKEWRPSLRASGVLRPPSSQPAATKQGAPHTRHHTRSAYRSMEGEQGVAAR